MTPEEIRTLYDFNAWANERMFAACAALTPEQFNKPIVSSFPSVRDTVVHIVAGEWLWLQLWLVRPFSVAARQSYADGLTNLTSIRTAWTELECERRRFLDAITPAGLEHVIEYQSIMMNRRFAYSLCRMLQHVVNHSTYHRGQVTTMLRQLGAEPRATDFLRYFDWLSEQPEG